MRTVSIPRRLLALAAATAFATLWMATVTAAAVSAGAVDFELSSADENSLTVMLTQDQKARLAELLDEQLDDAGRAVLNSGGRLKVKILAERLEQLPDSDDARYALGGRELVFAVNTAISYKLDDGAAHDVSRLSESVNITLELPSGYRSGDYLLAVVGGDATTPDLDNVPNTVTLATDFGGAVLVMRAARGGTAADTPAAQPEQTQPKQTPPIIVQQSESAVSGQGAQAAGSKPVNPKAGGVPASYMACSVLVHPVAVANPAAVVQTAQPADAGVDMAAMSLLMTAAQVSGEIDYQNQDPEDEENNGGVDDSE